MADIEDTEDTEEISIDTSEVERILNDWSTAMGSFEPQKASANAGLLALQSAGLESGFIHSYDANFESAKSQINNAHSAIFSAYQTFLEAEDASEDEQPNPYPRGGGAGPGEEYTDEELKELQLKEYEKLSLENLDGITDELIKLAKQENVTLDELLSNEKYQEKLKDVLSSSKYVPEDLKKLVLKSGKVSQELLEDISNGKYPSVIGYDENVAKVYQQYLYNVAKNNNIDYQALLNDDKYKDILKQAFKKFGSVTSELKGLDDSSITSKLKRVASGEFDNTLDEDTLYIMKEFANSDDEGILKSVKNGAKFGVFTKMSDDSKDVKKLMTSVKTSLETEVGHKVESKIRESETTKEETKIETKTVVPSTVVTEEQTEEPVVVGTTTTVESTPPVAISEDGLVEVKTSYVVDTSPITYTTQSITSGDTDTLVYSSPTDDVVQDTQVVEAAYEAPAVQTEVSTSAYVEPQPTVVDTPVVEQPVYESHDEVWSEPDEDGGIDIPVNYVAPSTTSSDEETEDIIY